MVSVHGYVEVAQHAVGLGTDSNAVEMCSQAIMPNAQSEFYYSIKLHLKQVFRSAYRQELGTKLSQKSWTQEIK